MRHQRMAMADIPAVTIGDDAAGRRNFNFRALFKKIAGRFKRAGQVLFIAIQVCENIALRAAITTINGIIHAPVFFNERPNALAVWQPVLRAVVRTRILHDVLQFDTLLVGHGRDAELEPFRIAETRCDNGEFHGETFNIQPKGGQILVYVKIC